MRAASRSRSAVQIWLKLYWGSVLHHPYSRRVGLWVFLACLSVFAQLGLAQGTNPLRYFKNYFVTGDYVVAGVGLRGTGVNGMATGTINVTGVPVGADIVAAFLYWQSIETTSAPSAVNGKFDGNAIVGDLIGSPTNPPCWSTGGNAGPAGSSGRVYRADVMRYLKVDPVNTIRIANGAHTVSLPDNGTQTPGTVPLTNGATWW